MVNLGNRDRKGLGGANIHVGWKLQGQDMVSVGERERLSNSGNNI